MIKHGSKTKYDGLSGNSLAGRLVTGWPIAVVVLQVSFWAGLQCARVCVLRVVEQLCVPDMTLVLVNPEYQDRADVDYGFDGDITGGKHPSTYRVALLCQTLSSV
jgi:hypothetical protein